MKYQKGKVKKKKTLKIALKKTEVKGKMNKFTLISGRFKHISLNS